MLGVGGTTRQNPGRVTTKTTNTTTSSWGGERAVSHRAHAMAGVPAPGHVHSRFEMGVYDHRGDPCHRDFARDWHDRDGGLAPARTRFHQAPVQRTRARGPAVDLGRLRARSD